LAIGADGTIYMSLGDPGFAAFTNSGTLINAVSGFDRAAGVALYGNSLYGVDLGHSRIAVFSLPEPSAWALAISGVVCLSCMRCFRWWKRNRIAT